MKLSKALLSAIMVGITLQTIPACKKEKPAPTSQKDKNKNSPTFCPGCGMG